MDLGAKYLTVTQNNPQTPQKVMLKQKLKDFIPKEKDFNVYVRKNV